VRREVVEHDPDLLGLHARRPATMSVHPVIMRLQ
jgi:hypothetical protein